jgi:hypothetical protein
LPASPSSTPRRWPAGCQTRGCARGRS